MWAPWNLKAEKNSTIGPYVEVYNVAKVSLGERCIVSQNAELCTASHDHNSTTFELIAAPISLRDNTWIAAGAFIGPGVTVSENAVVGARAVLFRSIGKCEVFAGNPAKLIGLREVSGKNFLK